MFHSNEYEVIPLSFFQGGDVLQISRELIGKYLFHETPFRLTVGRVVETEAYNGRTDRACHAFKGRTKRTEIMYQEGGRAYVYLCYGIHHLFNIVTNKEGFADVVLIRALDPIEGIDLMRARTRKSEKEIRLASGPGMVGKAMGFDISQTGEVLGKSIWLARKIEEKQPSIVSTTRIGVDYAGEDAKLPWRYFEKGNKYVSKK